MRNYHLLSVIGLSLALAFGVAACSKTDTSVATNEAAGTHMPAKRAADTADAAPAPAADAAAAAAAEEAAKGGPAGDAAAAADASNAADGGNGSKNKNNNKIRNKSATF